MDKTNNKEHLNVQCEIIHFEKAKRYAIKLNGNNVEELVERITKDMLLHNHTDFSEQTVTFFKPYVKRVIEKKSDKKRSVERASFFESYNDPDFKVDCEKWFHCWILESMYRDIQKLDFEYKDDLLLYELAIDSGARNALAKSYIQTLKELIAYMQRYKLENIKMIGKNKINLLISELECRGITTEYIMNLEITFPQDLDIKHLGVSSTDTNPLRKSGVNSIHQLLDVIENKEIYHIFKNHFEKSHESSKALREIESALICRGLDNCELVNGKYIPIRVDCL